MYDGGSWCPQLDELTQQAEVFHLGEVQRWKWSEWETQINAAINPGEQFGIGAL